MFGNSEEARVAVDRVSKGHGWDEAGRPREILEAVVGQDRDHDLHTGWDSLREF